MKKVLAICLIVIGVVAIALGVVSFLKTSENNYASYASKETYGGDAYTGIQNAAATTANNVRALNYNLESMHNSIMFGFGSILVVAGLALSATGIGGLLKKKEKEAAPAVAPGTGVAPRKDIEE